MSFINVFLIFLYGFFVPEILGTPFDIYWGRQNGTVSVSRRLLFGYIVYFASFQLMAPIFIIRHWSFSALFYSWLIIIASILVGYIIVYIWSSGCGRCIGGEKGDRLLFWRVKDLLILHILKERDWLEKSIIGFALFAILVHTFIPVFFMHFDTDDARFVAEALEAYEKNTLLMYHPITGEYLGGPIGEMLKDVWSPYPIFIAILGKLFLLTPAVVAHSILPAIYIPLAYVAFYQVCSFFFKSDTKSTWIAVLLYAVVNTFSMETVYSFGWTLLTIVWQGRSMFYVVFLPVMWYLLIRFTSENEVRCQDCIIIVIVEIACCMASGTAIILSLLMTITYVFIIAIIKRNLKRATYLFISMVPIVIYFILYNGHGGIVI